MPGSGKKRDIDDLDAWAAWMKSRGVSGEARFDVLGMRGSSDRVG
jgi:hypothetical protein